MNGCVYRTIDNKCSLYTDEKHLSWCVIDDPCADRKPSNADKLRSMTETGLAVFLSLSQDDTPQSYDEWLAWLREAAP